MLSRQRLVVHGLLSTELREETGGDEPVTSAPSEISTPWWTSYRDLSPRRMEMVDSTVGSSICTGWNRRSSAASLPIVFRYSSASRWGGQ